MNYQKIQYETLAFIAGPEGNQAEYIIRPFLGKERLKYRKFFHLYKVYLARYLSGLGKEQEEDAVSWSFMELLSEERYLEHAYHMICDCLEEPSLVDKETGYDLSKKQDDEHSFDQWFSRRESHVYEILLKMYDLNYKVAETLLDSAEEVKKKY